MTETAAVKSGATPLFEYPHSAKFGRLLPKNKIYVHARPSNKQKKMFTEEVAQITWAYKLAPETIHLSARPEVPEIQIFLITLKDERATELSVDVSRCIDRAIGFPIIFEVVAGNRVQIMAAYKRPSDSDSSKWVIGDYLRSDWHNRDAQRAQLPVALDLAALYRHLLTPLIAIPAQNEESLKDHHDRLEQIRRLEKERVKLEKKLSREKQFNRKIDINARIRELQEQIDSLLKAKSSS